MRNRGLGGGGKQGNPFPFLFQGTAIQRLQQAIHDPAKQMLADPDGLLSVDGQHPGAGIETAHGLERHQVGNVPVEADHFRQQVGAGGGLHLAALPHDELAPHDFQSQAGHAHQPAITTIAGHLLQAIEGTGQRLLQRIMHPKRVPGSG